MFIQINCDDREVVVNVEDISHIVEVDKTQYDFEVKKNKRQFLIKFKSREDGCFITTREYRYLMASLLLTESLEASGAA